MDNPVNYVVLLVHMVPTVEKAVTVLMEPSVTERRGPATVNQASSGIHAKNIVPVEPMV